MFHIRTGKPLTSDLITGAHSTPPSFSLRDINYCRSGCIVAQSQPAVSQHLRVLRQDHLVQVRKQGQQRIYSIDPQGLAELREYIESFWDTILDAFQEAAEKSAKEETDR